MIAAHTGQSGADFVEWLAEHCERTSVTIRIVPENHPKKYGIAIEGAPLDQYVDTSIRNRVFAIYEVT